VKRLEKPAPEIEELHSQWARMRGTVVLNGEQIEKLRSLDWTGSKAPPIESGEKLVRFIQDLNNAYYVDARSCEACRATRARLCAACARIQVERIKAETRRYAEDAKTQRAHYGFMREPGAKMRGSAPTRASVTPTDERPEDEGRDGRERPRRR